MIIEELMQNVIDENETRVVYFEIEGILYTFLDAELFIATDANGESVEYVNLSLAFDGENESAEFNVLLTQESFEKKFNERK
jgi:hypothetical protein